MESSVLYHSDGNNEITHKVVFLFKDISCFETSLRNGNENIGEESIPRYDARNRPYPINVVTELFESYEEAKRMAEEQNEKHRRSLLAKVSVLDPNWKEKMETLNQEFEQKLKINNLFEQVVLEETKDMEVSQEMPTNEKERFMKILKPEKTEYKR